MGSVVTRRRLKTAQAQAELVAMVERDYGDDEKKREELLKERNVSDDGVRGLSQGLEWSFACPAF